MRLTDILPKTESYNTYWDRARCNANGIVTVAKSALQNKDTYIKTKLVDGTYEYTWNSEFIGMIIATLESGKYSTFGKEERKIVDEYIQYINGTLVTVPEYIYELDKKLGEMI